MSMPVNAPTQIPDSSTPQAIRVVSDLIDRAKTAQTGYAGFTQHRVDEVVTAVALTLLEPATNRRLSEQAVADTGLGRVADKITKNHRKTLGLLRDLKHTPTVGVIARFPEQGLIEIARPVGVVGAVLPSTNPVATPYNMVLNALKCGNAIIMAPSPKGQAVCVELVELMRNALRQVGAPLDLVQKLPQPASKDTTYELMRQVDLVVVTGSANNVRAAYSSGSPAIGVGAGNVPSIVDETADLDDAAAKITASKVFDNATSCSSENSLVVLEEVYDAMITALQAQGARRLTPEEKALLQEVMWAQGKLSNEVTGKSAAHILHLAQIKPRTKTTSMILVEEETPGLHSPFCDEKLSPVLTVFRARNFDHACELVKEILNIKGKGHSVSIHSQNQQRILQLGLTLPVCRVIVNQAHCFATGGSFDNGLPFSLSMGCGTWGRNSISENLHYRHYLNTTRIVCTIAPSEPDLEEIFGDYWRKYNIRKNVNQA